MAVAATGEDGTAAATVAVVRGAAAAEATEEDMGIEAGIA
jgi:hypothetical protein